MTIEYTEDQTVINEHYELGETGYNLHVMGRDDGIAVWLNLLVDFNGLAIGGGESRVAAIKDAVETLERAVGVLREGLNA